MTQSIFLEEVRKKLTDILDDKEKLLLDQSPDAQSLLRLLDQDQKEHLSRSHSRRLVSVIRPAVDGFEMFSKALDVLCNASPAMVTLLWGSFRIVLRIIMSFAEFFDDLVSCINHIGQSLNRMETYEKIFSHAIMVQSCLEAIFGEILSFFIETRRLLMPRKHIKVRAAFNAFKPRFEYTRDTLSKLMDRLDKEAVAAGLAASMERLAADERSMQRNKLQSLLKPVDSEEHHESVRKNRQAGTCSWVFDVPVFKQWSSRNMPDSSFLWISGNNGAGKTVLASSIIDHLQATNPKGDAVAFFYFDFKEGDRQGVESYLATVIVCLADQNNEYFQAVANTLNVHQSFGRMRTRKALENCLIISGRYFRSVRIVIDALDECSEIDELMEHLQTIRERALVNIKFLLISRPNGDIKSGFESIEHLTISMKEASIKASIQKDIATYIEAQVSARNTKYRDPTLKAQIIRTLTDNADGMFLWVKSTLEQLKKQKTDKASREALLSLPKGLNAFYLQHFERLSLRDDIAQIIRMFRWLVHSSRPLDLNELIEAIAIEQGQETFDASAVFNNSEDLFDMGEGLVVRKSETSNIVQLSHSSVREFLVSKYCSEKLPNFYMGSTGAHEEIISACLTVLTLQDTTNCEHLWTYASSHWAVHCRKVQGTAHCPSDQVFRLLDMPVKADFVRLRERLEQPSAYLPVHYCAQYGLTEQLKRLLRYGVNINADSDPYGSPLNFAARYNQRKAADVLIDWGADVNLVKKKGDGPGNNCLHWALDDGKIAITSCDLIKVLAQAKVIDMSSLGGLSRGQTPLHYAARANRVDLVDVLLSCRASIEAPDDEGKTPLRVAVEEHSYAVVHALMKRGASMSGSKGSGCRDSGYGPSIDSFFPGLGETWWATYSKLKTYGALHSESTWGIDLGKAAQRGRLDMVQALVRDNIGNGSSTCQLEIRNKQLESNVGVLFGALTAAGQGNQLHVVEELLRWTIRALESFQSSFKNKLDLDIHLVIIHDRSKGTPFCESTSTRSALFLAIVLGHLRLALEALSSDQNCSKNRRLSGATPLDEARRILIAGGYKNANNRTLPASLTNHNTLIDSDSNASLLSRNNISHAEKLCERARELWQLKRNPRSAINAFITQLGNDIHPCPSKSDIITIMWSLGCNVNSLDRAGRTPAYWAAVRSLPEVVGVLEQLKGRRSADLNESFRILQSSICRLSTKLLDDPEFRSETAWDTLGRYLCFAGDHINAVKAWETGAHFDASITGHVPAYHDFVCDICEPLYREDRRLTGYRMVPFGLANIDFCSSCANRFGEMKVRVPSDQWIKEHEDLTGGDNVGSMNLDPSRSDLIPDHDELALRQRDRLLPWLREMKGIWASPNQTSAKERYRRQEALMVAWILEHSSVLVEIKDLWRW